jgi:hypothetical protein
MKMILSAAQQRPVARLGSGYALSTALCAAFTLTPIVLSLSTPASAQQQAAPVLLNAMTTELHRAFTSLGKQGPGQPESDKQLPPYFLSYSVSDASYVGIRAQYGALGNLCAG